MSRAPRRRALVVLATLGLLVLPATATAQEPAPPSDPATDGDGVDDEPDDAARAAPVRLVVSALRAVLGPGSVRQVDPLPDEPAFELGTAPDALDARLLVHHRGSQPLDSLSVVVEIHPAAESRTTLRQALRGEVTTDALHVRTLPVRDGEALRPGEVAGVALRVGPDEMAWAHDGGVHPVRVAVLRGTEVLDEVVTAVVWLARVPEQPLRTVLVWPIDAPPARTVGGVYEVGSDDALRPGGRLDELLRALERVPGAPVVLAPAAHLLEELQDRADGFLLLDPARGPTPMTVEPEHAAARLADDLLRRVRDLARTLPFAPVASSWARADLAALTAPGIAELAELAAEAAAIGGQRLRQILEADIDASVQLVDGATSQRALDLLPGNLLLAPYAATADDPQVVPDPREPVRPLRTPAGRALTAIVADPYLASELTRPDLERGAPLAVQNLLADTAMAVFEAPGAASRALLLLPEPGWDPGVHVASALLDGVGSATWLTPTSPAGLVAQASRSDVPVQLADATDARYPERFTRDLTAAAARLAAVLESLPPGMTTVGGLAPSDLRDTLLRASSHWLRGDESRALSLVRDVRQLVDETFGEVRVADAAVTLTSDTGAIPVTIQRASGGPLAVRVEVASTGRLLWPQGRRSEILHLGEGDSLTVSFATEAISTGRFPVTVRVTDPSGRHELYRTVLPVRSTTISTPALAVIGALVAVLLLVGLLRRRAPRPHLEVVGQAPRPQRVKAR